MAIKIFKVYSHSSQAGSRSHRLVLLGFRWGGPDTAGDRIYVVDGLSRKKFGRSQIPYVVIGNITAVISSLKNDCRDKGAFKVQGEALIACEFVHL